MPLTLVPPPATNARAEQHDAMVAHIAHRVCAIGELIGQATALSRADESRQLNALRRQLDLEMQRLEYACDDAHDLALGDGT